MLEHHSVSMLSGGQKSPRMRSVYWLLSMSSVRTMKKVLDIKPPPKHAEAELVVSFSED